MESKGNVVFINLLKLKYLLLHPIQVAKAIFGIWPSDISISRVFSELPENAVVVEAGTGEGVNTMGFAENLPQGKIWGLEPIEPLFNIAKQNCKHFTNVNLFNMALVETGISVAELYSNVIGNHESSSMLRPTDQFRSIYPKINFDCIREIPGITLDEFCSLNKISTVDLLWLDLQGSEMSILKNGGLETLKRTRFLHSEVIKMPLYQGVTLVDEFLAFMEDMDFQVIELKLGFAAGNALLKNNRY